MPQPTTPLSNVLWIGGGCGAGKSTVARSLAHALDLRLYPIDAYTFDHEARAADLPVAGARAGATFAQRWLESSVDELVERFVAHAVERFALIVEDLARLPPGPAVIVEGPQLLPELLDPHVASSAHAIWLLPTEDFARRARTEKGVADPDADEEGLARKLQRLITRDARLTTRIRRDAVRAGQRTLEVDGARSPAEMEGLLRDHFGAALGALPRARDGAERQRIRQAENGVVSRQLAAYWHWLTRQGGNPEPPTFAFACECPKLGCTARTKPLTGVSYEAWRAAGRPATAPGHDG